MIFEPSKTSRIFAQPLGSDFPAAVTSGLRHRYQGYPPHAIARATLIVNTSRMARRIKELFASQGSGFLPRIHLLSEIGSLLPAEEIPEARSPLRRRLQLAELIAPVVKERPELAAQSSVFAFAESLAALMDEMQGEGVTPEDIAALDVSDQSGHWQNAQALILIAHQYVSKVSGGIDPESRQRLLIETLVRHWEDQPPEDPIILAGSTGSRGTTMLLMEGIARLGQGAVLLPGVDTGLPENVWAQMTDGSGSEDHPQFRFAKLFQTLRVAPEAVPLWDEHSPIGATDRTKVLSLALRPAPVTDAWLKEGPDLPDLVKAMSDVTLVEATSRRQEAMCIALRLRMAAEEGQKTALITPDRMLSRQVAAALDRWKIVPDDSAGSPLHLSPPGRFLRHVAQLFTAPLDGESLLTLLKHPLTQSGPEFPKHGLYTQDLELLIRRDSGSVDSADSLRTVAEKLGKDDEAIAWITWLCDAFFPSVPEDVADLETWLSLHRTVSENIAGGAGGPGDLWDKNAGREAARLFAELEDNAGFGGSMTASEYTQLFSQVLSKGEVRDRDEPHPDIMIWGTLEARVQGADLVILGGLNDGVWPEAPTADPWLNRTLRQQAGLLLPDRKTGLSAHDFQQGAAANEIWMTRSVRSDDSETVASRWVNRLLNLIEGLPECSGPQALAEMRMRGDVWRAKSADLEQVVPTAAAGRAAPCPPALARPRDFSVTEIKTLIRDPYAIYARHCLRLRKLDPLVQEPDAPIRGIVIHEIMNRFVASVSGNSGLLTSAHLMDVAETVLSELVPWPTARIVWQSRLERVADWIVETEAARMARARPVAAETTAQGRMNLPEIGGSVRARADRIDQSDDGSVIIYDYKSGSPPGKDEQTHFDKQLLIEAAMVENGAFETIGPSAVADAIYIGLGSTPKEVPAPLEEESPQIVYRGLINLLSEYLRPDQPYLSRRMLRSDGHGGDYDHLARFGEWEDGDPPHPEDLS